MGNTTLMSRWNAVRSKTDAGMALHDVSGPCIRRNHSERLVASRKRRVPAQVDAGRGYERQARIAQRLAQAVERGQVVEQAGMRERALAL